MPSSFSKSRSNTSSTTRSLPSRSYGASEKITSNRLPQRVITPPLPPSQQIKKHVRLNGMYVVEPESRRGRSNEIIVHGVYLHRCDGRGAPRSELVTYRARTREEIERLDAFEIQHVAEDVEKILLGEIGSGARPQVLGRHYGTPAATAAYDPHKQYILNLRKSPPKQSSGHSYHMTETDYSQLPASLLPPSSDPNFRPAYLPKLFT